jgi:hypothetical protein
MIGTVSAADETMAATATPAQVDAFLAEIRQLGDFYEEGLLTEDEYFTAIDRLMHPASGDAMPRRGP